MIHSQSSKKNRLFSFFSNFCSAPTDKNGSCQNNKKKVKNKIQKTPRLTFQLDRVLVKISRKNIGEDQFMENEVINFQLQKHLAMRLKDCDFVVFSGQFSSYLMDKFSMAIQLKQSMDEATETLSNYVVCNRKNKTKLNFNIVETFVCQLFFGPILPDNKSSQITNITSQSLINLNQQKQLDQMESILKFYFRKVKNFVFICNNELKYEQVHELFLVFKQFYLFEFQRVKKIQKHVCNIIYVTTNPKFLKIDSEALCEFVIDQFEKFRVFEPEEKQEYLKLTKKLQQQQSKKGRPSQQSIKYRKTLEKAIMLNELTNKERFAKLIMNLLNLGYYIEVTQSLGIIIAATQKKPKLVKWFLDLVYERCPGARDSIDEYLDSKREERNFEEGYKTSSEFTPAFQIKPLDSISNLRSTALFGKDQETSNPSEEIERGTQQILF